MHYPWWYVPYLTAPMLIGIIATVHVLVSHYAVGGGLFLAVELNHAYRTKDRQYLEYLKRHAAFFILLTVVFGAITGVGIWWTIGLASPLATELLIRTFVFGWATEWVFFVLEIISAFIVYYYWGKLAEKTHVIIAGIYALAAWISLVLITGITAFMANPGDWINNSNFWTAFFNPQFIPQVIARTGGALLLTSLYVYLHASLVIKDCRLQGHDRIAIRTPGTCGGDHGYCGRIELVLFPAPIGPGDISRRGQFEYTYRLDFRAYNSYIFPLVFRALSQSGLAFAGLFRGAAVVRPGGLQHR